MGASLFISRIQRTRYLTYRKEHFLFTRIKVLLYVECLSRKVCLLQVPRTRSYSPNITSLAIEAKLCRQSKVMVLPTRGIFLVLGGFFTLTGVIALIAYGVLIANVPETWFLRNYYFTIWSSVFILFSGIQVLIEAKCGPWSDSKVSSRGL